MRGAGALVGDAILLARRAGGQRLSLLGGIAVAAFLLGPFLGRWVAVTFGWRVVFLLCLPPLLLALLFALVGLLLHDLGRATRGAANMGGPVGSHPRADLDGPGSRSGDPTSAAHPGRANPPIPPRPPGS